MTGNTIKLSNYGLQETKVNSESKEHTIKKNYHLSGKRSEVTLKKKGNPDNPLRFVSDVKSRIVSGSNINPAWTSLWS